MMPSSIEPSFRHQCHIYDGAPSRHLPALAAVIHQKLKENYRCLYLDSPPMVAGMRSYLAAAGVDVTHEISKTALVLSSEQNHLEDGLFDIDKMMRTLEHALNQALSDGFAGLWASGDMSWEFGPANDFSKLLEYEWRLEQFLRDHPQMGGSCNYHVDTLPREVVRRGFLSHHSLLVNETLSLMNPLYLQREAFTQQAESAPEVELFLATILESKVAV